MSVSNGSSVCFTLFDLCDHVPLFAIHKHKGVLNANNTTSTNQSFWLDSG